MIVKHAQVVQNLAILLLLHSAEKEVVTVNFSLSS